MTKIAIRMTKIKVVRMILIDVSKFLDRLEKYNTDDPIDHALYRFARDRVLETDAKVNLIRCGECECHRKADKTHDAMCVKDELVQPKESDYCSRGTIRTKETPATLENFGLLLKRLNQKGGQNENS